MLATVLRKPEGLPHEQLQERRLYAEKCKLAAQESLRYGVLERDSAVVDVGCRSPKVGLYRALRQVTNWLGQYVGLSPAIPEDACRQWNAAHDADPSVHRVRMRRLSLDLTTDQVLAGHGLPFPPTAAHPFKMICTAFCIDTLGTVRNPDALVWAMKACATQVVVVCGVTDAQLIRWEFQTLGGLTIAGREHFWGVWMDAKAHKRWQEKNRIPNTVMGFFGITAKDGVILPKRLGVCQKCGQPDPTGKSRFGCSKCGADNDVRRMADNSMRTVVRGG